MCVCVCVCFVFTGVCVCVYLCVHVYNFVCFVPITMCVYWMYLAGAAVEMLFVLVSQKFHTTLCWCKDKYGRFAYKPDHPLRGFVCVCVCVCVWILCIVLAP